MNRTEKAWRKSLSYLATVFVILIIYALVMLPVAVAAPANESTPDVLSKLGPWRTLTLILVMIGLVAFVFYMFLQFGRRFQMRGYLGPLVADAVSRAEMARQEARLREDLRSGKIEPELAPGSDKFNKRYGIPMNEPVPPLIGVDKEGRILPNLEYADPWGGNTLPGSSGADNFRPEGTSNADWWEFVQRVQDDIPNWTAERLMMEREDSRLEQDQPHIDRKKLFMSRAIKDEINRRFFIGYRQERLNAFQKKRAEITDSVRKRTESILPMVDVSSFGGGWTFVLEFTTIIFIVFSVLTLGVVGVLSSEPVAAILAAIAGYVLGKSTNIRAGDREGLGRGTEEPKALFEALTKQEVIKSLRDEEKLKLQREVDALQLKLNAGEAETKIIEKYLAPTKKEVANSKQKSERFSTSHRRLTQSR